MSPDPLSVAPPRGPYTDLVAAELPGWKQRLADGPVEVGGEVARVDAAGLQLLVSALRWSPGRVRLDLAEGSAVAILWRRLGLDDLADAEPVVEEARVVALRASGGRP